MANLLAAEYLKLRTTKTAMVLLVATLALTGLAVAAAVIVAASNTRLNLESTRGVRTVLHVSASGAIFVLVLGIIISAGEFRQSTATDTFLTTPARWKVAGAKLTVGALAGVVFGALSASVAIAVANHVYTLKGYTFPLSSSGAWSVLGGAVLYAAFFGALGAATGSLVRDQVSAIVAWLTWLLIIENILLEISSSFGRWLPGAAGRALVRDPNGNLLTQPTAALVLLVYSVAIIVLVIFSERRRDA